jgi:hypothetical protein
LATVFFGRFFSTGFLRRGGMPARVSEIRAARLLDADRPRAADLLA